VNYLELALNALKDRDEAHPVAFDAAPIPSTGCEKSEISETSHPAPLVIECETPRTLAEAEGMASYWYPPPGTLIFFQDADGQPCSPSEARIHLWTHAGAPSWYCASVYPPP
jgi:hypothetical protein